MQVRKQGEYFGDQRWALAQKGISLSEYDYIDSSTPWHFHENPYFMYVIQGNMMDINKKKKSCLAQGSLMFLNWEEEHCSTKESKIGRGFHLQMDRHWLVSLGLDTDLWEGSAKINNPNIHHQLGNIYHEFRQSDSFSALTIEVLVIQLCIALKDKSVSGSKSQPAWIKQLKEIIHEGQQEITLANLSKELGVHPVHISRTIPIFLNSTLGEYLRKEKIKKAFPLLLNKHIGLSDIAFECKFSDQSHFTRIFKQFYGITPSAFRKSL